MRNATFLFILFFASILNAQPVSETIHANNIQAVVKSNGALFWDQNQGQFKVPFGPGDISTMRSSGLWIAGLDERGFLHGAIQKYNENGKCDFEPGLLDGQGGVRKDINKIWKVTKEDIDAHLTDFKDNGIVDNPIPSIFGYPGRGNRFFNNHNNFSLPVGGLAPFEEASLSGANNNGLYEPDLGEYPVIQLRGCGGDNPIVADEMLTFVYHDSKAHTESQMEPLDIQVVTQVFAFKCDDNPILNNTIFVNNKIINYGESNLDSTHIALFADFDIGCKDDDFVGCFPSRNVFFGYNGDEEDSGCGNGFGLSRPVQATTILRGPIAPKVKDKDGNLSNPGPGQNIDTFVQILPTYYVPFGYGGDSKGDPQLGPDYLKYMSGSWKDNAPMDNNGVFYDGDPNDASAWSEVTDGNTPGDRRMIATMGPFDLNPFTINEILVAYSSYYDPNLSHLENVSAIYENSGQLKALFNDCFLDPCSFTVGTSRPSLHNLNLSIGPNPNDGHFTLQYDSGSEYEIINVSGQTIIKGLLPKSGQTQSGRHEFNLNQLKTGAYFIKVTGNKESGIAKFIIK